jgi:hypothetical protein
VLRMYLLPVANLGRDGFPVPPFPESSIRFAPEDAGSACVRFAQRDTQKGTVKVLPVVGFPRVSSELGKRVAVVSLSKVVYGLCLGAVPELARGVAMVQMVEGASPVQDVHFTEESVTSFADNRGIIHLKHEEGAQFKASDCVIWRQDTKEDTAKPVTKWFVSVSELLRAVTEVSVASEDEKLQLFSVLGTLKRHATWMSVIRELVKHWAYLVSESLMRVVRSLGNDNIEDWGAAIKKGRAKAFSSIAFDLPGALLPLVVLIAKEKENLDKVRYMPVVEELDVTHVISIASTGAVNPIREYFKTPLDTVAVGVRPCVLDDSLVTQCLLSVMGAGFTVGAPKKALGGLDFTGLDTSLEYTLGSVVCTNNKKANARVPVRLSVKTRTISTVETARRDWFLGLLQDLKNANTSKNFVFSRDSEPELESASVFQPTEAGAPSREPDVPHSSVQDVDGTSSKKMRVDVRVPEVIDLESEPPAVAVGAMQRYRGPLSKILYEKMLKLYSDEPDKENKVYQWLQKIEIGIKETIQTTLTSITSDGTVQAFPGVPYLDNSCFISTLISMLLATSNKSLISRFANFRPRGDDIKQETKAAIAKCLQKISRDHTWEVKSKCVLEFIKLTSFLLVDDPNFVRLYGQGKTQNLMVGFCKFTNSGFSTRLTQDDIAMTADIFNTALSGVFHAERYIEKAVTTVCGFGHTKTENGHSKCLTLENDAVQSKSVMTINQIIAMVFNPEKEMHVSDFLCETCVSALKKEEEDALMNQILRVNRAKDLIDYFIPKPTTFLELVTKLKINGINAIKDILKEYHGVTRSFEPCVIKDDGVFLIEFGTTVDGKKINVNFTGANEQITVFGGTSFEKRLEIKGFAIKQGGVNSGHWFAVVKSATTKTGWALVNGFDVDEFDNAADAIEERKKYHSKSSVRYVVVEVVR